MKKIHANWDSLLIAAVVLVAGVCAQAQQSLHAQQEDEGKVVEIDVHADVDGDLEIDPQVRVVEEPTYWIGISGRSIESEVLRTHLQLAEEMGVVVEMIIPDSPAAKAGLRKHDIILRVNGDAVDNMQILQTQVRTSKDKPLELEIIRLGQQENLVVIPELRPEQLNVQPREQRRFARPMNGDIMEQLMELGARNIGPGMVFRGGGPRFDLNQMPNGVSVSIQRQNNGPAKITVQKGDQTWQIESDDQEALAQLPDDVRPFVQRMLRGQTGFVPGGFDFNQEMEQMLPRGLGGLRDLNIVPGATQQDSDEFERQLQRLERQQQRLDELERKIEQFMQQRLDEKKK